MEIANRILLVIDNEEIAQSLMEQLTIEGGYSITTASTVAVALELFRENSFELAIADFTLPGCEPDKLVNDLRNINSNCVIIGLSQENKPELLTELSKLGLYDYISRPFNWERVFYVVRKGIELSIILASQQRLVSILKEQNSSLQKQNILLAKRIEESAQNLSRLYEDLRSTYMRTIRALAQAIDARDHYTHSHSENVAKYSVAIAKQMGFSIKEVEKIRDASQLHDLGKIGITDMILTKPSSLTTEEWQQIKKHPETGAQILEPLTFLNEVIELVRQHHEHYDGTGYPAGRRDDEILLGARILHLADAFEAMTSARSYRQTPLTKEEAIAEIERNSGLQFDPLVVDAFLKVINEV